MFKSCSQMRLVYASNLNAAMTGLAWSLSSPPPRKIVWPSPDRASERISFTRLPILTLDDSRGEARQVIRAVVEVDGLGIVADADADCKLVFRLSHAQTSERHAAVLHRPKRLYWLVFASVLVVQRYRIVAVHPQNACFFACIVTASSLCVMSGHRHPRIKQRLTLRNAHGLQLRIVHSRVVRARVYLQYAA